MKSSLNWTGFIIYWILVLNITVSAMAMVQRGNLISKVLDKSFYHIPEVAPDERIIKLTSKYLSCFDRFTVSLPRGDVSIESFRKCQDFVESFYRRKGEALRENMKVILDSGCGKGSSTIEIGKRFPSYPVIGIERSHSRLSYNKHYMSLHDEWEDDEREESQILETYENSPNVLLIRAELSSFWHLLVQNTDWVVHKHFLLHPNPSPKPSLIKVRFPGSPSLPFFPLLGGTLIVRSNWKTYCEEFQLALSTAKDLCPPLLQNTIFGAITILDNPVLYSHFDRKYAFHKVPMYEWQVQFPERSFQERKSLLLSFAEVSKQRKITSKVEEEIKSGKS